MNRPELEGRLAAVLQRHAEDAMKRTNTEERLQTFRADVDRDTRRRRRRILAGAALVAAAAAIAVIVSVQSVGSDRPGTTAPAQAPETTAPAQAPAAAKIATGFVEAYGSFDRDRAATYLADDADMGSWRLLNRWYQATGFKLLLNSCTEQAPLADVTQVRCAFDYHLLHSEQLGSGPYSGNFFYLTIQDDKIVATHHTMAGNANGFETQMWQPFTGWVARHYPQDAAVMYANWPSHNVPALTPQSIALWQTHSTEYVDATG